MAEKTLAVNDLPNQHRHCVYTTNIMERLMREIMRWTTAVGIFPNESSRDGSLEPISSSVTNHGNTRKHDTS